ncbi:hypothetical protein [Martelella mangrovi]|uniref:Large polyvalent protein associated domain-containing protein n=1 Tax=Martelella mangrovi TaxID=1397477 RepID=A0ABV2IEV8_9HYPH
MQQPTEGAGPGQPALAPEEVSHLDALRQGLLEQGHTTEELPTEPALERSLPRRIATDLVNTPRHVARGGLKAVNATSDAAFSAGNWLNEHVADLGHLTFGSAANNGFLGWEQGNPSKNAAKIPLSVMGDAPQSAVGGLTEGVAQFAVGFATAGKALKAFGFTAEGVAGAMAKGAMADASAFDPHEERLSNLIEAYPVLSNPVSRYLAAGDEDGEAEGRFKNALEGLALGGATELLASSVKALKLFRKGKHAEAEEVLEDIAEKTGPEVNPFSDPDQMEFSFEGGGPGADSPRGAFENNPGAEVPPTKPKAGDPPLKPVKKLVEMDEEAVWKVASKTQAERELGDGENLSGIRLDLIENGEDVGQIMSTLRDTYRKDMDQTIGGNAENVRSFEQVQKNVDRLADIIGGNPKILMQRLAANSGNMKHLDAETRLYEDFLTTVTNKVYELGEKVSDPRGGTYGYADRAALLKDFAKHYELLANVQSMYKGIQTNLARSLNAMKMGGKVRKDLALNIDPDEIFNGGAAAVEGLARRVTAGGRNPKNVAKSTRGGFLGNALGTVNEYWVNAILSGPKTHLVNIASSLINTALLPAEKALAGALRGATPQGRSDMLEAGLQYVGMVASFRDAVKLSAKSFKLDDGILDPFAGKYELRNSISSQAYGIQNPGLAAAIDGLGKLVRLPSRFLTSEDEFIKQLNYRGQVRARAYREALQQGLLKDPKKFAEHVENALDSAIDSGNGRAFDSTLLEQSRSATFTNDLKAATWSGKRTVGESLQNLTQNHPTMRLIMPFVRTPTNIMRFVWNRTPGLNLLRKQYADDIMGKNGKPAQAQAAAMMTTGTALWGTAISFASEGTITGYGPRDPDLRKQLMETGWQPYSVKTTNDDGSVTYTAFDRADPFGMFFGLSADFAEVGGFLEDRPREELAAGLTTALVKNLSSKSYLTGLTQALDALSEPERRMGSYFRNFAGSFVPAAVTQMLKQDPYMREVRTVMDAIHARTPGFSTEVDPRRTILGEKVLIRPALGPDFISPVAQNTHLAGAQPNEEGWKETPQTNVDDELARQMFVEDRPISLPPKKKGTVDLTQYKSAKTGYTAYDRWQELTGTVELGGMTLRQRLNEVINSDAYRNKLTDGDMDLAGSRSDLLRRVVGTYRKAAEAVLRQEDPELDLALRQAEHLKALTKRVGADMAKRQQQQ